MSDEQPGGSDPIAKAKDGAKQSEPSKGPGSVHPLARFLTPRMLLYAAGAVMIVLGLIATAVYVSKVLAVRGLEQRMAAERAQSTDAQHQALAVQAHDLLRLTARPMAWAVRAEMLKGNLDQVDNYFREFVRERGVSSLILVGKDGRIALATNRKLETRPGESVISKALLAVTDVATEETGTAIRIAVPIMGFDSRLGLLVIDYDTEGR